MILKEIKSVFVVVLVNMPPHYNLTAYIKVRTDKFF